MHLAQHRKRAGVPNAGSFHVGRPGTWRSRGQEWNVGLDGQMDRCKSQPPPSIFRLRASPSRKHTQGIRWLASCLAHTIELPRMEIWDGWILSGM